MPRVQRILTRVQVAQGHESRAVRLAVVGRVDDEQPRQHAVVDLAPEHDDARLVEYHRWRRLARIELQHEDLRGGEGIDRMADVVAVREVDRRAGLDHAHPRYEPTMDLIDDGERQPAMRDGM